MTYRRRQTTFAARRLHRAAGALVLISVFLVSDALGQANRPERGFYATTRIGLSFYDGENNLKRIPVFGATNGSSYAASFGGGYYLTEQWSVGLEYKSANYPHVAIDPRDPRYYTHRHTAQITARYMPVTFGSFAPYATAGFHITRGARIVDEQQQTADPTAYGPTLGAGVDFAINPRFAVFVEAVGNLSFPDDAFDAVSGSGTDVFGFIGTGLRVNLARGVTPIRVYISGPDGLETGTVGTFTAITESGSGEPTHYVWNLGDGTILEGTTIEHAYFQSGTYDVMLRASNQRTDDVAALRVIVAPRVVAQSESSFEQVVQADVECELLIDQGEAAYVTGQFVEAIATIEPCFSEPRASVPVLVQAHRLRTLAFSSDGNHVRAREEVDRLLDLDPAYEPDAVQDPPSYTSMVTMAKQRRGASGGRQTGSSATVSPEYYILPSRVLIYADDLTLTETQRAELLAVSDVVTDVERPLLDGLKEDRELLGDVSARELRDEISERVDRAERQLRALYRNAQQQVLLVLTAEQRIRFNQLRSESQSSSLY